jgi:hypothetical protein
MATEPQRIHNWGAVYSRPMPLLPPKWYWSRAHNGGIFAHTTRRGRRTKRRPFGVYDVCPFDRRTLISAFDQAHEAWRLWRLAEMHRLHDLQSHLGV